jgi:hypothetical protein
MSIEDLIPDWTDIKVPLSVAFAVDAARYTRVSTGCARVVFRY